MNINDTKSMEKYIGKAIKVMRLDRRLTQAQLVKLSNGALSQGNLSKIELGKIYPRKETLSVILKILKCTPEELWQEAVVFMDSRESWVEDDADELLECLKHESLGLDPRKVSVIKALVSKEDVFTNLFRDFVELRAGLRTKTRSQINHNRVRRLRETMKRLPFETVEQVIAFSDLFSTLLVEATDPLVASA